ncbi:MBL fold metallo-hydrolase [Ruminococcaceae bacterium OttesenSCG-928-A16]|nr:MBL fold metallo-hydrolase [Ruminococcaceae bacterium OttesenSCG-928-A16]
MRMIHIVDGPPLYTNCFLLLGNNGHAAVIDPAASAPSFEEALAENGATLTHILLTHGHPDHITSVEPLRQKYGAKLCMNEADARQFGLNPDVLFTDGGKIQVDDMEFTTLFTPGHTPGSTCIACGDWLFTGDTLFAGDIGRTDLPGGDTAQMMQSLKKLCDLVQDNPMVLPGHEEFSTMNNEKMSNPYLRF